MDHIQQISGTTIGGRSRNGWSGLVIDRVAFDSCYVPRTSTPGTFTTIADITLANVSHANCELHTARLERVHVDGLKRIGSDPLFLWGCVFDRVVLAGNVAGLKINRSVGIGAPVPPEDQALWDRAVKLQYEAVDWALDISRARFAGGVTFEALPGDKIRRDCETQALVKRDKLRETDWEKLDFGDSGFGIALGWFIERSQFDSVVLAARVASKHGAQDVAVLDTLRKQSVAE